MPSSKWIGCSRTRGLTLTNSRSDGSPMRLARARILLLPWTGPTLMPIIRRRLCCRWSATMAARRRLWLTVDKATLKNHRNAFEDRVLRRLAEALPAGVKVLILADRGFGDQKLDRFLTEEWKFDYLIRFRGNIAVTSAEGETRPAADWVGVGGRPRTLRNALVTADSYQVGTVVCVHARDMKEPWCLAASTTTDTAKQLMMTYAKRWGIESGFRDTKDLRFGMGMASIRVSRPERRDRLWLLNAFAAALLTLLGAAGEALGYDRHLKSNTSKQRTHSLFRQGAMLYDLIPMMPEPRLRPLVERFGAMLLELPAFAGVYGAI